MTLFVTTSKAGFRLPSAFGFLDAKRNSNTHSSYQPTFPCNDSRSFSSIKIRWKTTNIVQVVCWLHNAIVSAEKIHCSQHLAQHTWTDSQESKPILIIYRYKRFVSRFVLGFVYTYVGVNGFFICMRQITKWLSGSFAKQFHSSLIRLNCSHSYFIFDLILNWLTPTRK